MKKNEDRIWDILLEDAVRDIPTPAEPQEMGDHTRRLLQPVGPLGVDRGRSMRRTRGKRWTSVTVTAIAFVLVAAMFYSAVTWLPKLAEDNHTEQPQSADSNKAAIGLPTMLDLPRMTAFRPTRPSFPSVFFNIWRQP